MMDKSRWSSLLKELHLVSGEQTFNDLVAAYSEPHRAYHTDTHINDCLSNLDVYRGLLRNPAAVELAIWFHDAIYQPFSNTNEEDSANWAVNFLSENGATDVLITEVSRLIVATKHNVPLQSNDASVLVDIDLAILGSESQIYDGFEQAIRYEYRKVPGFLFRKKRANILRSFLDRQYIYSQQPIRDLYEAKARANMERAVIALSS